MYYIVSFYDYDANYQDNNQIDGFSFGEHKHALSVAYFTADKIKKPLFIYKAEKIDNKLVLTKFLILNGDLMQ